MVVLHLSELAAALVTAPAPAQPPAQRAGGLPCVVEGGPLARGLTWQQAAVIALEVWWRGLAQGWLALGWAELG